MNGAVLGYDQSKRPERGSRSVPVNEGDSSFRSRSPAFPPSHLRLISGIHLDMMIGPWSRPSTNVAHNTSLTIDDFCWRVTRLEAGCSSRPTDPFVSDLDFGICETKECHVYRKQDTPSQEDEGYWKPTLSHIFAEVANSKPSPAAARTIQTNCLPAAGRPFQGEFQLTLVLHSSKPGDPRLHCQGIL